MKPKVLVISVSYNGQGGIATVVNTFMHNKYLNSRFDMHYRCTNNPGSNIIKLISTLYLMFLFPFVLLFNNFDLAHIHGGSVIRKSYYTLWLKFFRIPVIYQNHAANFDVYYKKANIIKRNYLNYVFSLYDIRLCLGFFWMNTLQELTGRKWNILYNPVSEINLIKRHNERCNFTFIGELSKRKGIKDLIYAFALQDIKNAHLLIAGNGDVKQLSELCSNLGILDKVEFLGWVNHEQKLDLLTRTDVVVLPSYAEGLPMSILEAMSVGLPVITTSVGAVGDAVTHNIHGLLVQPGDIEQISLALNDLASNIDKRIKLGKAAKLKFNECFSEDVVAKDLACFYYKLIGRHNE
ncbi:glycosyltransferase family 4 protein [Vibrio misgurnus]|uniref:glycosyltransferase family 4 protein n=1 Tax=Vibrio misgurnus TaxID=2993714 RepID=UPI002417E13A|nr:glycosyltransferase family 4 protein [Vibrio sp. gvc]